MADEAPTPHVANAADLQRARQVLIAVGTGTFLSALDGSKLNAVLPEILRALAANLGTGEWVISGFLLVVSGLMLSVGRLGDLWGQRRLYLFGYLVFVGASAACGLAQTIEALIGFRLVQAFGAAFLFASSPAILTRAFPASYRGRALGTQATMTYLGLSCGPALGGWLTDQFGWRSVFLVNIPIGVLAMVLAWRYVPDDLAPAQTEPFDLPGALLWLAGLGALIAGLNRGPAWGWASREITLLLATAAFLLAAFAWREGRTTHPVLDVSLLQHRVFTSAVIAAVLNYIGLFTVLFLMPFYLIRLRQFTVGEAGTMLTALPVAMALMASLSGRWSDRFGTRALGFVGLAIQTAGLLALARSDGTTTTPTLVAILAFTGIGNGTFIAPNNSALMGAAPRHRQGIAGAIMATARNLGMVLGVALAGAIVNTHGQGGEFAMATHMPALAAAFTVAAALTGCGALAAAARGREQR